MECGETYWASLTPKPTDRTKQVMLHCFGMGEEPHLLSDNQSVLSRAHLLIREGEPFKAWLLVAESNICNMKWYTDLAHVIGKEE